MGCAAGMCRVCGVCAVCRARGGCGCACAGGGASGIRDHGRSTGGWVCFQPDLNSGKIFCGAYLNFRNALSEIVSSGILRDILYEFVLAAGFCFPDFIRAEVLNSGAKTGLILKEVDF